MRWVNVGFGVAVVTLLALNLQVQLATQRKLDALAVVPPPSVVPAPSETAKVAATAQDAAYVIEPPDILLIASEDLKGVGGQHLVRPDGTISLGVYGSVEVSGLTLDAAKRKVQSHLSKFQSVSAVNLDVLAFNSKAYYVITQSPEGDQVLRKPCCGNETVLDAVGMYDAGRKVSVARRTATGGGPWQVLPVDLAAIKSGETATNYQLMPGDRVYLAAK